MRDVTIMNAHVIHHTPRLFYPMDGLVAFFLIACLIAGMLFAFVWAHVEDNRTRSREPIGDPLDDRADVAAGRKILVSEILPPLRRL